ncbi:hypothetical protein [Flavitalea sp.]|nr:hypothetical protein [Flavitalea sp.]
MGRQINFFLHPGDQESFDKLLKSFGDVVLFRDYHNSNHLTTIDDTLIKDIGKEKKRVYLMRPKDFKNIQLEYVESHHYWHVNSRSLPVVHFDRSVYINKTIERGRLYFEPRYVNDNEWVNKPDDFINWADKVLKAVRRNLKKYKYQMGNYNYTDYLGASALNWLQETEAKVASAGCELIAQKS